MRRTQILKKYRRRKRRIFRVRGKISGTSEIPRLCVYRSLRHIYAQLIDDTKGITLTTASTLSGEIKNDVVGKKKTEAAVLVGKLIAERAKGLGIEKVVFDKHGFKYHGRVKALADGAREGGLKF